MTKPFISVSALALAGSVRILNGSPAHAHGNAGLVGAAYAFADKITGEHLAPRAQAVKPKMGGNFRVSMNVKESSVALPQLHRPMGAVT